jgi:glutamyl-tRNA synthetase
VIRLKINDGVYKWNDLIRGEVEVPSDALTDPVLIKANNTPMYNFAVVIDDTDMLITHVLRGEEHLSNTPYQMAIKQALGFSNEIKYGHLPIIIDEQGKKLSKRNETLKQFIEDYYDMGFLPEAIVNFLALIG